MQLTVFDATPRFSCGHCTACCDQPWRTMIEAEKAAALDRHDWSGYPQLAGRRFYHAPADGRAGYFDLAKGEGTRCLFLGDDGLCIIHKELGPEAKPSMCRQFPFLSSRTWTDDRISVNYGCPSVQGRRGPSLQAQSEEVLAVTPRPERPYKGPAVQVQLDGSHVLSHEEYEAIIEAALSIFSDDGDSSPAGAAAGFDRDVRIRFDELLGLLEAARESKRRSPDEDLRVRVIPRRLELMQRDRSRSIPSDGGAAASSDGVSAAAALIDSRPRAAVLHSSEPAPLAVRMLFAATLYPDTLPAEASGRVGLVKRLLLVPRLMALAKLSGVYASRIGGRNISIDQAVRASACSRLSGEANGLLLRYFRSRFWQRLIVGTRLPIVAGVHQHILDLNAILFFARSEAVRTGETMLTEALVRRALTGVEFHLANQRRLYEQTLKGWLRGHLADLDCARRSLWLVGGRMTAQGSVSP